MAMPVNSPAALRLIEIEPYSFGRVMVGIYDTFAGSRVTAQIVLSSTVAEGEVKR